MSESNKVTRKQSFLSKFTGIFKKKKKEPETETVGSTSSNSSPSWDSQGQTKRNVLTSEAQSNQESSKTTPQHGVYRKIINNSDATSSHETSSAASIDQARILQDTIADRDNKATNNPIDTGFNKTVINVGGNGQINDKTTAGSIKPGSVQTVSGNESRENISNGKKIVEAFNNDVRIDKSRINNGDDKILIKQIDSDITINLDSGKGETKDTQITIQESSAGKTYSEIRKKEWFNNEIKNDVQKIDEVLVTPKKFQNKEFFKENVTSEDVQKIDEVLVLPKGKESMGFLEEKIKEQIVVTDAIILGEKGLKVEEDKGEFHRDQAKLLIEVEKNEKNPEDHYFTTGKYLSYFLLEIEKQYYDPSEVYSMVRYRESEDSDESDMEGENSSSESTSPHLPATLRRRLIHRRSADNLIVNSPTNSMRHSSPESVRSAPIHLKPRSTSHDALSKRKEKQSTQNDGISMDSLAKQSLLAAQVLNLIPAQKARERNFLHGRIAATSLLGAAELEKVLPNREVKIFVGTWNMNGQPPPKELNDFMLPSGIETIPDMLAIGTQESYSERSEWEAALQETLGPSHVLLTSTSLGTLHLALFIRRDLIWFCSIPEDSYFSTRTGTAFRTKGAVALAIMLFGTSFLFVTAHLTAHQDKVKERVNDIKRIVKNLDLPRDLPTRNRHKDVTENFDCVFWCGDLNFRLAQPRDEVIQWITNTEFPQESPINLNKDQLRITLNEGSVLEGFEEADIMFPPTYKYDQGTQNFDSSSKQRTPAYTDRILFKGKARREYIRTVSDDSTNSYKDGAVECLLYDSVPTICTSDHKPVWGVFKTTIRPGIDTIPLAAGLFNRDVYLEGIKRRAAAMDDALGVSRKNSRRETP